MVTKHEDIEEKKVFISYSWSTPNHEEWVMELAERLVEDGVDVIIDKWELNEGGDKYVFMERMVTDDSVDKVLMICDKDYTEKADNREGGVGDEAQIISKEIYDQVKKKEEANKFIPIIAEINPDTGEAYTPTFLTSKIFVDLSSPSKYAEGYEQLLRVIYDKPKYSKPEKGDPPTFITQERKINLGTSSKYHQAINSVKKFKPAAKVDVRDYFETFAKNLERFRLDTDKDNYLDEIIVDNFKNFLPYRDELIDLILAISEYQDGESFYKLIKSFLEDILPYKFRPENANQWDMRHVDNYELILYNIFLYVGASLLKYQRFSEFDQLIREGYFINRRLFEVDGTPGLVPFVFFRGYVRSFKERERRLNQSSSIAITFHQCKQHHEIDFDKIMEVEFILFIRDCLRDRDENYPSSHWYPYTLFYSDSRYHPFEIFARSEALSFFKEAKQAIGIDSKEELESLYQKFGSDGFKLPNFGYRPLKFSILANLEKLSAGS